MLENNFVFQHAAFCHCSLCVIFLIGYIIVFYLLIVNSYALVRVTLEPDVT